MTIEETFKVGVAVGVSGTIISTILIWIASRFYKRLREKWHKKHAFIFIPDGKHKKIKAMKIPIGKSTHIFWVKAYKSIELKGFTIRFVPTEGIKSKSKQVPSSIIEITEAKLKWDTTDEPVHKGKNHIVEKETPIRSDEPSKWHYLFDGFVINSPESKIGTEITVNAKKPWKGYFSIEGRSQEKRYYGRIKSVVTYK